jgi:hypothetical protein
MRFTPFDAVRTPGEEQQRANSTASPIPIASRLWRAKSGNSVRRYPAIADRVKIGAGCSAAAVPDHLDCAPDQQKQSPAQ